MVRDLSVEFFQKRLSNSWFCSSDVVSATPLGVGVILQPEIFLFFPRASERRVLQKEGGVNRSTYKRYLLTSSRI